MKIWLDDIRKPPDESWTWVSTAEKAWALILKEEIESISFDHDLGDGKLTGYDLAKTIEEYSYIGGIEKKISWNVHSANPVGRKNIEQAMKSAERFWINE